MHYAKIKSSPRLQRVLTVLRRGRPVTTREIIYEADVCAVNSIVAELKANGCDIECRCIGRGRFEYQLNEPSMRSL